MHQKRCCPGVRAGDARHARHVGTGAAGDELLNPDGLTLGWERVLMSGSRFEWALMKRRTPAESRLTFGKWDLVGLLVIVAICFAIIAIQLLLWI